MSEYIGKQEIIDEISKLVIKNSNDDYEAPEIKSKIARTLGIVMCEITKMSKADVAPVVHGRWIKDNDIDYGCSACGRRQLWMNATVYEYCPHCGAIMDERTDNND